MPKQTKTPSEFLQKREMKGSTLLGPLPSVMVSCGTLRAPNIITVAWTGIANSQPPVTYVSIRPERYSHRLIREGGCFVINLTPRSLIRACDFCGIYTGAKVNKFERLGLTPVPSPYVEAPMIGESPVSLSCRVREVISLGSHDLFLADVVGISAAECLFDETGKLHMDRADPTLSMHGAYYSVGACLGKLGHSTDKKPNRGKKGDKKHG